MRNMSFALTTDQIRRQTKTVTRRLGWRFLKGGELVQPVEKAQGIKKGEQVKRVGGPIRVVSVRRERLDIMLNEIDGSEYGRAEIRLEGFGYDEPPPLHHSVTWFVEMFCRHNRCTQDTEVTRIEFVYETTEGTS